MTIRTHTPALVSIVSSPQAARSKMRHPSIHLPRVVPSSSTTPTGIGLTIVDGQTGSYPIPSGVAHLLTSSGAPTWHFQSTFLR
jgi:hypothetical protein